MKNENGLDQLQFAVAPSWVVLERNPENGNLIVTDIGDEVEENYPFIFRGLPVLARKKKMVTATFAQGKFLMVDIKHVAGVYYTERALRGKGRKRRVSGWNWSERLKSLLWPARSPAMRRDRDRSAETD